MEQSGKDSTHPAHSFPHWHFLSLGDPSVSLSLASSPKRGAKGVDESPRADFDIVRTINRRNRLPNHRHSEEGEARRGNPFSFLPDLVFSQSQGDADSHDQCSHWSRNDRLFQFSTPI